MSEPAEPSKKATTGKSQQEPTAKDKQKRTQKPRPPLLFIDTNILLDFYRARNDAGVSLLSKVDSLHDQTITTCQVEMEFKKNRQKVMAETVLTMKAPEFNLSAPAFLADAKAVKVIKNKVQEVKKRTEKLKGRILATMGNPKTRDRIYQTIQRLFVNPSPLNLRHDTPEFKLVWRKALRRFLEGRPPRKKDDTSAGDAINWEWIVHCIKKTNRDVIIVSRDADYGLILDEKGYANDWLADELKERVKQNRKLILVDRLSSALKLLDVKVTPEEVSSERAPLQRHIGARENEIESLVDGALFNLMNEEAISSLIAQTNTAGWSCDSFELGKPSFENGVWTVDVSFTFEGEQEDDKPWHGTTIYGRCVAQIDKDKGVTLSEVEAELDLGDDDPGDDDPQTPL